MRRRAPESLCIRGHVRLWARGHIVAEADNLIVSTGKALVSDMLIDTSGYDTGLTYTAIGTGTTAPVAGNTTLGVETARKAITLRERAANVLLLQTFFPAADCSTFIKEIGVFGHSTASATPDSGVLFARTLLSYDNSGGSPSDLTLDWEITIG